MCSFFQNRSHGLTDWADHFSKTRIPLRFPDPLPNPREGVRPTDDAPVIGPIDPAQPAAGLGVAVMRWDLIPGFWTRPVKAKTYPTFNARSESAATTAAFKAAFARRRCLVPADGFHEWTGDKGAKIKWLITATDQPWFCFAGLWDRAQTADGRIDSFTLLTTAAGADMAAYHTRQPVILPRERWLDWLDLTADPTPLFAAGRAGALRVERAEP